MAMLNPYKQYQKTQNQAVLTADPGKLTLMLYDGAAKFTKKAIYAVENKRIEDAHNNITKTQDIVLYLSGTLNNDYNISKNLNSLYDYLHRRLLEANIKKDKDILEEVLSLISELRDTWAEAYKQSKTK